MGRPARLCLGIGAADVGAEAAGGSASADVADPAGSSASDPSMVIPAEPCIHLQKGVSARINYKNFSKYGLSCMAGEPKNLMDALGDDRWKTAMNDEFVALQRNKTWHLVPPQQGRNLIDCKWVYRIKKSQMAP